MLKIVDRKKEQFLNMTNIQKYREINKISKHKLAQMLNITRTTIILWEKEKQQPCIDNAIKLAAIFNTSPLDFIDSIIIKVNLKPIKYKKVEWSRHELVLNINNYEQD